ncbi:hypothetical protein AURDEDRAFT_184283, partial [Auricularia subglabra TFB-10046 SS5]
MSILVSLLFLALRCRARLVTVTIDDYPQTAPTGVSLEYSPTGDWLPLPTSDTSTYKIDWSQVHTRTLHTGPWPNGSMTITFVGTMISMFLVLDAGSDTDLFFFLDGGSQPDGRFFRPGDGSSDIYLYNQLVHKSETLTLGKHSMRMDVSNIPRIFFDFAVVTSTDDVDVPAPSSSKAPAAGGPPPSATSSSSPIGTPADPSAGAPLSETGSPSAPVVRPQSGAPSHSTTARNPVSEGT